MVAYSRFGYGQSEPPLQPYTALEMHQREALETLPAVLEALRIERPILFGHSDGASIALIFAGARPRAVSAVVALAPHVFVEPMCLASIAKAKQSYLESDLARKLARYHNDPHRAFHLWNEVWLDPIFPSWSIEHYLESITCRLLAIQGDEDEYGTMEQLERLRRGAPHGQLLRLAQCRHSPHRDHPEAVLAAVSGFVQPIVASRPNPAWTGQP